MSTEYATAMTDQNTLQVPRHWAQGWAHCAFTPQATIAYGQGETILLAEKDAVLLKLGKSLLENLGYRALTASSHRNILELCRAEKIEMIVFDVEINQQPGGMEHLLAGIKELQPTAKILLSSSYDISLGLKCCLPVNNLPILSKPFTVQSFSHAIYQCLNTE